MSTQPERVAIETPRGTVTVGTVLDRIPQPGRQTYDLLRVRTDDGPTYRIPENEVATP